MNPTYSLFAHKQPEINLELSMLGKIILITDFI